MLSIKLIRERPDIVRSDLEKRGSKEKIPILEDLIKTDEKYRKLLYDVEKLRHERNSISVEIAKMKKAGKDTRFNLKEMQKVSDSIAKKEADIQKLQAKIYDGLMKLPNILHESVPKGKDEGGNVEVRKWGKTPDFGFAPKSHVDLLQSMDLADIERAAKVAGARFYYLKNEAVLLDIALQRFALDSLQKKGFILVEPPFMIKRKPYEGAVDFADFETMIYKVENEDLYLIATAEHPLVSMFLDEIMPENCLPALYAGVSPCFRKEAGAHGKDTKGIFRVHQFNKVEQVVFCRPEESWDWFERLIKNTEELYQKLELPYRVVNICTGEIGSIAAKKYDLEGWFPAQQAYRELASCSNTTDFQARRLGVRFGKAGERPKDFVHILNNTGIAMQRTIVAIIENFQQKDGGVTIPKVLRPYMNGLKRIEPKA